MNLPFICIDKASGLLFKWSEDDEHPFIDEDEAWIRVRAAKSI